MVLLAMCGTIFEIITLESFMVAEMTIQGHSRSSKKGTVRKRTQDVFLNVP